MNLKVALVVLGVLIGGLIGYLQRPEAAEIKIGPIELGCKPISRRRGAVR